MVQSHEDLEFFDVELQEGARHRSLRTHARRSRIHAHSLGSSRAVRPETSNVPAASSWFLFYPRSRLRSLLLCSCSATIADFGSTDIVAYRITENTVTSPPLPPPVGDVCFCP